MNAMPARTLSPFRATDRALLSPSSRYPPHPPPDSPHHEQQRFQRRAEDPTVLYDVTGPPHDSIARMDHNPFTAGGHADAVPHPMRRPSTVGWYIVSGQPHATAHVPTPSPPLAGWLPHPPHLTRIAPLIPPPPLIHKVWILDCQSCGTFLTNRGMKAVLLLRPTVPLYSTDALPVNCSAYASDLDHAPSRSPVDRQPQSPNSPPRTELEQVQTMSRTCECLTQTLLCHSCGKSVGYMIVIPCHRCTSSMTVTNRMTNGHRFVFYSSEISPSERHYVPGECGVTEYDMPPISPTQTQQMPVYLRHPGYIPTSPTLRSPTDARYSPGQESPTTPPPRRRMVPETPNSLPSLSPVSPYGPHLPQPVQESTRTQPERIRAGDVLYWHNLIRSGEIPAVKEDPRARGSKGPSKDMDVSSECKVEVVSSPAPRRRKMLAGR